MLTQTAEYALRAVLYIAATEQGEPMRAEALAEALSIPRNYLSKVLHVLARTGMLTSIRGPQGGFLLAREAEEITLGEVIHEFYPLEDRCLLMDRECGDDTPCVAHHRWKVVAAELRGFFRETTVEEIVRGAAELPIAVFR